MLTITITPAHLIFEDLTDELQKDLVENFHLELEHGKRGLYLGGTVVERYKALLDLAYKYDIEIK